MHIQMNTHTHKYTRAHKCTHRHTNRCIHRHPHKYTHIKMFMYFDVCVLGVIGCFWSCACVNVCPSMCCHATFHECLFLSSPGLQVVMGWARCLTVICLVLWKPSGPNHRKKTPDNFYRLLCWDRFWERSSSTPHVVKHEYLNMQI